MAYERGPGGGESPANEARQSRRRGGVAPSGKSNAALRAAVAANADGFARDLAPAIVDIRACGNASCGAIAAELDARDMSTRRGGRWHRSTFMTLLMRLDG